MSQLKEITNGEGVPVVYDSVGKDTFESSLKCLRPFGLLVSFGNASGPVPPVDLGILAQLGSLYITRPTLATYTAKHADLEKMAQELFGVELPAQSELTLSSATTSKMPLRPIGILKGVQPLAPPY